MKLLIFVIFLLYTTSLMASSDFCVGKANGLYRNPVACTNFYHCSNGYTYLQDCPKGLHFSVKGQICDWPSSANCKVDPVTTLPPPTTENVTELETTLAPSTTENAPETTLAPPASTTENPPPAPVHLFRYYNEKKVDHFYTSDWSELGSGKNGYTYEGIAGKLYASQADAPDLVALHRYYNAKVVDHFYTTSLGELGGGENGYDYEGIAGFVWANQVNGSVPLYRYYHTKNAHKDHFYTVKWEEIKDGVVVHYKFEGIQAFILP